MKEEKIKDFLIAYYKKLGELREIYDKARYEVEDEAKFYNGQYEATKNLQIEFGIGLYQITGIKIFDLKD